MFILFSSIQVKEERLVQCMAEEDPEILTRRMRVTFGLVGTLPAEL